MDQPRRRQRLSRPRERLGPAPWALYALVLLFDLLVIIAGIAILTQLGDWVEDLIWPGGTEWIE